MQLTHGVWSRAAGFVDAGEAWQLMQETLQAAPAAEQAMTLEARISWSCECCDCHKAWTAYARQSLFFLLATDMSELARQGGESMVEGCIAKAFQDRWSSCGEQMLLRFHRRPLLQ